MLADKKLTSTHSRASSFPRLCHRDGNGALWSKILNFKKKKITAKAVLMYGRRGRWRGGERRNSLYLGFRGAGDITHRKVWILWAATDLPTASGGAENGAALRTRHSGGVFYKVKRCICMSNFSCTASTYIVMLYFHTSHLFLAVKQHIVCCKFPNLGFLKQFLDLKGSGNPRENLPDARTREEGKMRR